MKRIGIITLTGYTNYGNRLQNYALQQFLISLGYSPETINIKNNIIQNKCKFCKKMKEIIKIQGFTGFIKKLILLLNRRQIKKIRNFRYKKFKLFSEKYINNSNFIIGNKDIELNSNINEYYDYFIVGSDQVWNPYFPEVTEVFFLTFASEHKRISYSASFGINELPCNVKDKYKKWLSNINHISVREESGIKIVEDLINIKPELLVDPTLLLTKDDWLKIAKIHEGKPKAKYILTYFLGGINKEYKKEIKDLSKKYNLKVVHLADITDKKRFTADPSEFLDYINSATLFFTDSFHGTVFSLIFNTPFVTFNRGNMNSRIDTILKKFNLENRRWSEVKKIKNYFSVDFSNIDSILYNERQKAKNFLLNSLS